MRCFYCQHEIQGHAQPVHCVGCLHECGQGCPTCMRVWGNQVQSCPNCEMLPTPPAQGSNPLMDALNVLHRGDPRGALGQFPPLTPGYRSPFGRSAFNPLGDDD